MVRATEPVPERPSTEAVGLTREAVVDAAVHMVETEGVRALSMRKLATTLGVKPASIYWHVGNREALLDAIDEHLAREFELAEPADAAPREQLTAIAYAMRATMRARVGTTDLLRHEDKGLAMLVAPRNAMLRAFRASGLDEPDALEATRAFLFHVIGFVLAERMSEPAVGLLRSGRAEVAGIDVADGDLRGAIEGFDTERLFAFSIDRFLRALLPAD